MHHAVDHLHGPGGAHSHAGIAFTTWLDFNQAAFQADTVKKALAKLNVAPEETLRSNFNGLIDDLKSLDTALNEMIQGYESLPLLASHTVYQYLARRDYDLLPAFDETVDFKTLSIR